VAGCVTVTGMKLVEMEPVVEGLYASAPVALPFARDLEMRAFLLERATGNLLIYGAPGTRELEGVWRQYLNHWHEVGFAEDAGAPLFVHAADRAEVEKQRHVRAAFSRRHRLDDDVEVIPVPGHTPGATAYLWDTGSRRILFTGDTIFLRDGEWRTAVLDSSDRDAYRESLALIRELDFDVLVPWIASGPSHARTDREDTRRRIDALLERL
jgi:glyoxylase-like metal-dependent hydrolase (beta-lactamase superfamily II)